jgi:hypothetical protein
LLLAGCSRVPARKTSIYQTGDRAPVDKLNYSIVDTQILTRLGEDSSVRTPRDRFYVIEFSVFNSGTQDAAIPALTLVDDAGNTYNELADGSGVARWLGVVRHVAANQTETGTVVFDAPASHYKLKLTDDTDSDDVFVDLPLSFAHEQIRQQLGQDASEVSNGDALTPAPAAPAAKGSTPATARKK